MAAGCNQEVTMSADMEMYWTPSMYDGVNDYSHDDYTCTLKLTIPATYMMFMANMELMTPSLIYETIGCKGDNLVYTASSGNAVCICGTVSGKSWSESTFFDGPKSFSFTWTSVAADG
ncbi:unnamed protein product, partial [Meganyctiphanes norvegica]